MYTARSDSGVTVTELIVVLGVVAILLGLLLPALQIARSRARAVVCKNNLRQMDIAFSQYVDLNKSMPPERVAGRAGGWMVEMLPFVEKDRLNEVVINSNAPSEIQPPNLYLCPERQLIDAKRSGQQHRAHYVLVVLDRSRHKVRIYDAPVDIQHCWTSGPSVTRSRITDSKGPHQGAYHYVSDGVVRTTLAR